MNALEDQLERLKRQEALLQFPFFSNDDAWRLGTMLVEAAKERKVTPAFEITINGYVVFRYGFSGTNLHNERWLRRKRNTVQTTHMSSLRGVCLSRGRFSPDPQRNRRCWMCLLLRPAP